MDSKTLQFIIDHAEDDPAKLALRASLFPEININFAVRQIAARQRAKNKIPTFYANPEILYPSQLAIEQSSSEITARHKASLVSGKRIVDLTGGFGVDFYFMAKKIEESWYVERQTELCEIASYNFPLLGLQNYSVINADSQEYINTMPCVDVVVVDPHRRSKTGRKLVFLSDCEPDLTTLVPVLFKKSKMVLAKLSPMLDIHKAVNDLPSTVQVDIVAVENECKEIILLLKPEEAEVEPAINCYNYLKNGIIQLFSRNGLSDAAQAPLTEKPLKYLYEPNAAIMKSGAVNAIAHAFQLLKFHPNTHLYTSNELYPDFSGRVFRVEDFLPFNKQNLEYLSTNYPKANVSVRNFILTAEEFRKKAKIKDGGDCYIFGLRSHINNSLIVICYKN